MRRGGFSKVYKGTKLDTYQDVAIKRIEKRKTSKEQFHMIEREVFSLTLSSEVTNGMRETEDREGVILFYFVIFLSLCTIRLTD
jgi:serine/threonine protein kinase